MSKRLTAQERADRDLLEETFRDQVNELAAIYGFEWMWVHPLRAAGGIWKTPTYGPLGKGWPDTTYIHRRTGRTLYVEFKKELGKTSPDQDRVLAFLRDAGLEAHVWRPSDFPEITRTLSGG